MRCQEEISLNASLNIPDISFHVSNVLCCCWHSAKNIYSGILFYFLYLFQFVFYTKSCYIALAFLVNILCCLWTICMFVAYVNCIQFVDNLYYRNFAPMESTARKSLLVADSFIVSGIAIIRCSFYNLLFFNRWYQNKIQCQHNFLIKQFSFAVACIHAYIWRWPRCKKANYLPAQHQFYTWKTPSFGEVLYKFALAFLLSRKQQCSPSLMKSNYCRKFSVKIPENVLTSGCLAILRINFVINLTNFPSTN